MRTLFLFLPLTSLILAQQTTLGQEFPTKAVSLIIPFGLGGGHDLLFRAVTRVAADYLEQPIII
jgi:tripartite-type tricarboxylate transporter receptor subunit TctC